MTKTAIVTGASRGLGLELAGALAQRGWRLVIDARGEAELEAVRAQLAIHDTDVIAIAGDVADPGDMNTRMHQEAFPGEDISDRPPPRDSVPGLLALVEGDLPSGRYRVAKLANVLA